TATIAVFLFNAINLRRAMLGIQRKVLIIKQLGQEQHQDSVWACHIDCCVSLMTAIQREGRLRFPVINRPQNQCIPNGSRRSKGLKQHP
ncbi:MAG: hypothetical protein ACRDAP_09895, partial [Shewanella sp.]